MMTPIRPATSRSAREHRVPSRVAILLLAMMAVGTIWIMGNLAMRM